MILFDDYKIIIFLLLFLLLFLFFLFLLLKSLSFFKKNIT